MCQLHYTVILIGYHTVDCTIPKYIWTSAQMTTNMIKSSGHGSKYISYCTVNCIITFLLYIQLLEENATFKLYFYLLSYHACKQQNVT